MPNETEFFDQLNAESAAAGNREAQEAAARKDQEVFRQEKARKRATRSLVARMVTAVLYFTAVLCFTRTGWMAHELAGGLLMVLMAWSGAWVGAWLQYRFGQGGAMYGKV